MYKFKFAGCNTTYHGKVKRQFNVQICEHLIISHLTGKIVKIDSNKLIAIQEHSFEIALHPSNTLLFSETERSDFKFDLKVSLLIEHDQPVLIRQCRESYFWKSIYFDDYCMMFSHIIWCPSFPLCTWNCYCFQCYVTNFRVLYKILCKTFTHLLYVTMKGEAFES